jgi:hypothetical protein
MLSTVAMLAADAGGLVAEVVEESDEQAMKPGDIKPTTAKR